MRFLASLSIRQVHMPFFSTISHKLRATQWRFDGNVIDFRDKPQIVDQLRRSQGARTGKIKPMQLADGSGVVNAQYRLAMATLGRPQYFEYSVLNSNGSPFAIINGIVGFSDSSNASHGVILVTTLQGEKVGHYDYLGGRALMELPGNSTSLVCHWEGATRSAGSLGVIYAGSAQASNELLRIRGQSRNEELGGSVSKHRVFHNNELLMEVYPEGLWAFNPRQLWRRLATDTIPVITYSSCLLSFVDQPADALLMALCTCRSLAWPLLPFDTPLGNA